MRLTRIISLFAALALLTAACLGEGGDGGSAGGGGDGGGSVEVFFAFTGEEQDLFEESVQPFIDETGINVTFEGSRDFETLITTRVQGGNPPDIALFPQPGLMLDVVDQANAAPLGDYLDLQQVEQSLIPGFLDAGTLDGQPYGLPIRMAVKSVLWYPVPEFEEAGYQIPKTQDELFALQKQIISDGGTPWCLGMESGDATGWVGTDWIEEYMLRLHGADTYDQWVDHEVPFDSPEVTQAFERFGEIWQTDGAVVGGAQGMLSIPFGDSPAPMFEKEPGCWLHRQGNFITGFFPEDVQEDLDGNVGAAYFPPSGDERPVLAGGDLALLISADNEAAQRLMEFLATNKFGTPWAEAGGWLSPHRNFDASAYPDEVTRQLYEIGANADILRFDASDLMPGAVGAGSFWTGIVDWVSGQDLQSALKRIDQSWPASGGDPGASPTATEAASE